MGTETVETVPAANSMLAVLQKPYVFAFVLSLATAVLVWLYNRTLVKQDAKAVDPKAEAYRSFFKTLAAGLLAGGALTYLTTARRGGDVVASEPFDAVVAAAAPPPLSGI